MATILDRIVEQTKEDLARRKREITFREFESMAHYENERRDFAGALRKPDSVSIIAEVKKASPSKGIIREDFDPVKIARSYINGGASAISVLTDVPFFQGDLDYLSGISEISSIPLLRKDFIVDPYQIKEARAYGADAVLLIVSLYSGEQLSELLHAAKEFGLKALVECYEEKELLGLPWDEVEIVGVNNRDLHTFEVDLHRGVSILNQAPEPVIRVSESGLHQAEDIGYLYQQNIHSALIGEHFMRQKDPGEAIKKMMDTFSETFKNHPAGENN